MTAPLLKSLIVRWQDRAHDALPADAMLINKHIRELRDAIDEADCIEADLAMHRWKQSGGPAREHDARAVAIERGSRRFT